MKFGGLKILSTVYLVVGAVASLEVLGVWGDFAASGTMGQVWKVYFSFCNLVAGAMLLVPGRTTQLVFVVILLAQLAVYVMWANELAIELNRQAATLSFYFLTLVFYFGLLTRRFKRLPV